MTRILVVSDLHIDHYDRAGIDLLASWPDHVWHVDLLVIAGDLVDDGRRRWKKVIQRRLAGYIDSARILLVPGNHDYFGGDFDREDRLASQCRHAGARFGQTSETYVGGTRILTCTLWTDYDLSGHLDASMAEAAEIMGEFRKICVASEDRLLTPRDTRQAHLAHRRWLEERLAQPFDGRTMVITHHAPHPACVPDGHPLPDAYASVLTELIERYRPDTWLYGHVHAKGEFEVAGCRLMNVSMGYPEEKAGLPTVIEV